MRITSTKSAPDYTLGWFGIVPHSPFIIRLMLFALCLMPYTVSPVTAQSPDVVAVWESDASPSPEQGWTVGDVIPLRLRVVAPETFVVTLPELPISPAAWGDFEVREQVVQSPVTESNQVTHILAVMAVLWSPGEHATPAVQVAYRDAAGNLQEVTVPPLTIEITSVLLEMTPNAEGVIEKQDLKPQAELPRPPLWPWILAGVAVAVLLYWGGRWLWQRLAHRNTAELEEPVAPVDDRPPDIIAYEKLDYIAGLALPTKSEFKQHYSLITECVRAYVEGRYAVPALDHTTYELMRALRQIKFKGEPLTLLRDLLNTADLVKFAKFAPNIQTADDALVQARQFVDITTGQEAENKEHGGSRNPHSASNANEGGL